MGLVNMLVSVGFTKLLNFCGHRTEANTNILIVIFSTMLTVLSPCQNLSENSPSFSDECRIVASADQAN